MAQPAETRQGRCPICRRWLYLVVRVPEDIGEEFEGYKPGDEHPEEPKRRLYRSEDQGSCRLWVECRNPNLEPWEEVTLTGQSGPEGSANGQVECEVCGVLDVADLKAHFEKVGF